MRIVGGILVFIGLLGGAVGYYAAYHAAYWTATADVGMGAALVAICIAIIGLLLIQSRS